MSILVRLLAAAWWSAPLTALPKAVLGWGSHHGMSREWTKERGGIPLDDGSSYNRSVDEECCCRGWLDRRCEVGNFRKVEGRTLTFVSVLTEYFFLFNHHIVTKDYMLGMSYKGSPNVSHVRQSTPFVGNAAAASMHPTIR